MILGMTNFTFAHVVLSLIGILSRFVVLYGLLTANRMAGWTSWVRQTSRWSTLNIFIRAYRGGGEYF